MEMHLEAMSDQVVRSPFLEEDMIISRSERIHTENSHKYSQGDIDCFAGAAGLDVHHVHTDGNQWFALAEFRKPDKNGPGE
jgi:L-histidine N-alpha-methyltransferase